MDLELANDESVLWRGTISWPGALLDTWAILTLGLAALVKRRQFEYVVTTDRVHVEEGLFAKTSSTVRINDVQEVSVIKSFTDRLLGIGDITFSSAGSEGPHIVFQGVEEPDQIQDQYNQASTRESVVQA